MIPLPSSVYQYTHHYIQGASCQRDSKEDALFYGKKRRRKFGLRKGAGWDESGHRYIIRQLIAVDGAMDDGDDEEEDEDEGEASYRYLFGSK